jgi:ATP/maltotriose-dependent transcriptional regulator MalT
VLVRAAVFRNDVERAMMLLNRAERLANDRGGGRLVAAFLLERVRLLLSQGRREEARVATDQLRTLQKRHPATERCSWTDIHIDAAVADGLLALDARQMDAAIHALTWAHDELLSVGNRHGALRVGLELSNAHFLAEDRARAFVLLRTIMGWATEAKTVSFALERQREFDALLSAARQDMEGADPELRTFLERLSSKTPAQDGTKTSSAETRASKKELTTREQAIVEFMAGGQSNKQIARTLGVTPETIKTHVKRIFVKLAAETRAQAVVRAQSLGFLRNIQPQ